MTASDDLQSVDDVIARARTAQKAFEANGSQTAYDRAAEAAAWAIMEPSRNKALAELAVKTTGLGNVPDKITKNHRKTLGLMRDIKGAKTHGIISENAATGITEIARPIGLVGAVVPSTNPAATPANNIINALKKDAGNHRSCGGHRLAGQCAPRLHLRNPCHRSGGRQCDGDRG